MLAVRVKELEQVLATNPGYIERRTEITRTSRPSTDEARFRREVSHKLASAVHP